MTLGEYLARHGCGRPFRERYLLPMVGSIWSAPAHSVMDFPIAPLLRFCDHHGLLRLTDHPRWRTVTGGGREYVDRLARALPDIRHNCPRIAST